MGRSKRERVYVLKISGNVDEQKRTFAEIKEKLEPYEDRISCIALPNGVTPLDFYLKEFAIKRTIEALERIGMGAAKAGVSKVVEGLLSYLRSYQES